MNHKKQNDECYYYQLPRIGQINRINISQLKRKPPKLNEDSAHNRYDKTNSSSSKAINTKQHIDCNGSSNSNENNDIDFAKRDKNNNRTRKDRILSSNINTNSTNTTANRSVVVKSPSVNANSNAIVIVIYLFKQVPLFHHVVVKQQLILQIKFVNHRLSRSFGVVLNRKRRTRITKIKRRSRIKDSITLFDRKGSEVVCISCFLYH